MAIFKRITRIVLVAILLLGAGFISLGIWTQTPSGREAARRSAEASSIQILASAKTQQELEEAVGHLGVIFRVRGGGWIAVRYRDTHAGTIWSSAVARDSAGGWFVSSEHFCGQFQSYRQWKDRDPELKKYETRADIFAKFTAIEDSEDLEQARKLLLDLGFQEVYPDLPGISND